MVLLCHQMQAQLSLLPWDICNVHWKIHVLAGSRRDRCIVIAARTRAFLLSFYRYCPAAQISFWQEATGCSLVCFFTKVFPWATEGSLSSDVTIALALWAEHLKHVESVCGACTVADNSYLYLPSSREWSFLQPPAWTAGCRSTNLYFHETGSIEHRQLDPS